MNMHTDILTIVYHYCDDSTKFKLRLLSKETYCKIDYVFYDDKWFQMDKIKINNDTAKIKKVKYVDHLDQLKLFPYMTHLIFSNNFNQEINIDVLPKSLTHLTLSTNYRYKDQIKENYPNVNIKFVDNVLPSSITHLIFGYNFNQEIQSNILPLSLTHLTFSTSYNYKDQIKKKLSNVNIQFV